MTENTQINAQEQVAEEVQTSTETDQGNILDGVDLEALAKQLDPVAAAEGFLMSLIVDGYTPNVVVNAEIDSETRIIVVNETGLTEIITDEGSTISKQKYDPETDTIFWLVVGPERFSAYKTPNEDFRICGLDEIMPKLESNPQIAENGLQSYIRHFLLSVYTKDNILLKEEVVNGFKAKEKAINDLLGNADANVKMLFSSIFDYGDITIPTWEISETLEDKDIDIVWGATATVNFDDIVATDILTIVYAKLKDNDGALSEKYYPVVRRIDNAQRPSTFGRAEINLIVNETFTKEELGAYITVRFNPLDYKVKSIQLASREDFNIVESVI